MSEGLQRGESSPFPFDDDCCWIGDPCPIHNPQPKPAAGEGLKRGLPSDLPDVVELLDRRVGGGTTVTNCVAHSGMSILKRPDNCRLCASDIKNTLARAISVNEWLNEWKDDAEKLLNSRLETPS